MATIRRKKSESFAILSSPGPWPQVLINWLATLAVIIVFGLIMLFSASYTTGYLRMGDSFYYIKSQVFCLGLGLAVMLLFSRIDHRFLRRMVGPGYVVCIVMLIAVLFSAPLNGCRRWLRIGFTIQVSEIAKFEMILLTAHLAAKAPHLEKLDPASGRRVPAGQWLYQRIVRELIVPLLPLIPVVILLMLEPHMSGIVLTTAICGTILLLGGSGGIITWAGGASAVLLLRTVLEHIDSIPYLQSRLDGWTHDLSKMTDQTLQSLYAIGSGGVTGLGLGNSIEKQLWLPESTNDFIFSVVCESWASWVPSSSSCSSCSSSCRGCGWPSTLRTATAHWWASASWPKLRGRCSATSRSSPTPCPTPASHCPSSLPAAPASSCCWPRWA